MPTISSFLGMEIRMFWMDHNPPHIHISYKNSSLLVSIENPENDLNPLPGRLRKIAKEWISQHRSELAMNWELAQKGDPLVTVEGWKE